MASSFNPFGNRGFHDFQQNYRSGGLNNHLNIFGQQPQQQHNEQQQTLSPHEPRSRGSSFVGSPTSPTSAHRPSMSQPSATRLQQGYFPIGATGTPPSATSPVSPGYHHSVSGSMNPQFNYGYDGSFGGISMHDESGITRSRNDSE